MLPLKNRLIAKKDFERVSRSGRMLACGRIAIKVMENGRQETRVGISVGLKFSKKAVARNRIKRQIRDIVRQQKDRLRGGFDIMIMARGGKVEKISSSEIKEMIGEIFKKGKLID
jgi:ribonuclease P protein component